MRLLSAVSLIALIGTGTLAGGCATRESVEHAQETADLARSDAGQAKGAADRAQSSADGAMKTAQDAMASAQMANEKVDKVIADMEKRHHTAANHHRHHRRHVASAENIPAGCPAPQQKTELKTKGHKTASANPVLQLAHNKKTAQN